MYSAAAWVIFCAVCTVLAFSRRPIYGAYFYLGTTFVYPPARWWGHFFGGTRWALIAAVVAVAAVLFNRRNLRPKPSWLSSVPAKESVLYAAWMWIQSPWAVDFPVHLAGTIQYTKYLIAYWFMYRIADSKEHIRDLLMAILIGCAYLGILGYMDGRRGGRLNGVGGPGINDANTLAMYFAVAAIIGLGLLLTQTGWRRWLSLACIVLVCEGLVLTNTRGAFLGFIGGGLVVTFLKAKRHRRLFWIVALIGLFGFASIVDRTFIKRMLTIEHLTGQDAGKSAQSRRIIIEAQLRMFSHYLLGAGHRGTAALSPEYLGKQWLSDAGSGPPERSSHNTFMTTLVEQGIPGAALFIWLTIWMMRSGLRLRRLEMDYGDPNLRTLASAIVGGYAVIFVAGNTADFLMAEIHFWLLAIFVSLLQLHTVEADKVQPRLNGVRAQSYPPNQKSKP